MMSIGSGIGALMIIVYFLVVAAVAILAVWALVLLVIFLRLRIAELRAAAAGSASPRR
jgi:hypothetical protein